MMNIVHNCLDKWHGQPYGRTWPPCAGRAKRARNRVLTYGELSREVNRRPMPCAGWAAERGDAIGLFMPMVPEIAIALLAIAKIGGMILPLFSGYGAGRGGLSADRCRAQWPSSRPTAPTAAAGHR